MSKRQDRPDSIFWLVRNHPELLDSQIGKLVGTTKSTIQSIRDRTHWNSANLTPLDPVSVGLCSQVDLDKAVQKAFKRIEKRKAEDQDSTISKGITEPDDFKVEQNKESSLENNNEEKEIIAEEYTEEDPNKEYTSDNVFAKLNELKESE